MAVTLLLYETRLAYRWRLLPLFVLTLSILVFNRLFQSSYIFECQQEQDNQIFFIADWSDLQQ